MKSNGNFDSAQLGFISAKLDCGSPILHAVVFRVPISLMGILLLFLVPLLNPAMIGAQSSTERFLKMLDQQHEASERITAIRALSSAVIQNTAPANERALIVDALSKRTQDADPVVRLTIHTELLKMGGAEQNPELSRLGMAAVNDTNINVRRGILKYFRTFYSNRYPSGKIHQPVLVQQLENPDLESRFHAAATLHSWGLANDRIIDVMLDSLDLANYRASSVYSLIQAKNDWPTVIDKVFQRIEESTHNEGVYINLIAMMSPASHVTMPKILSRFSSEQIAVRAAVVDAIGRMQTMPDESLQVLAEAEEDASAIIRQLILPSLVRLRPTPERLKQTIVRLLADPDGAVSAMAGVSMGYFHDNFDFLWSDVAPLLTGDDLSPIRSILDGLVALGPLAGSATPDVIPLLKHTDFDIQNRACWALLEMAADRQLAINALNNLLQDLDDERVIVVALECLSQFQPTDETSKQWFLKYLNDPNEYARYSCVHGLSAYADAELIEPIIKVDCRYDERTVSHLNQLDRKIVQALVAMGSASAERIASYIDHPDPFIRSRAMRATAQLKYFENGTSEKIISALQDESSFVQFAAAESVVEFDELNIDVLERVFALTDANRRQRTADVLSLFSRMGAKASPITPRIAELMNGGYRNRFLHDAKSVLLALGPQAAPALPELFRGTLESQKLACVAAIGVAAAEYEPILREYIEARTQDLADQRNLTRLLTIRRDRLAAAMALWSATGELDPIVPIISEELQTEMQNGALLAIKQVGAAAPQLVRRASELLPKPEAINALADLGPPAAPALNALQLLTETAEPDIVALAKRAVWQIQDDPRLAVQAVHEFLHDSRFEPTEIRIEQRQQLWDVLRFLADCHLQDPTVAALFEDLKRCRFPNLRKWTSDLLSDRTNF